MVNAAPVFPFDLGADVSKCNNDTIHIPAPAGFINYSWTPNYNIINTQAQTAEVYPTKATKYIASAEKWRGCTVEDSLWVIVNHSQPVHIGNDTTICTGDSTKLTAAAGFVHYSWNTGSTAAAITVKLAAVAVCSMQAQVFNRTCGIPEVPASRSPFRLRAPGMLPLLTH